MVIVIVAILGLIVGSFLNVVISRLNTHEPLFLSRSHCAHCKKQLSTFDLIPIFSFIVLWGKCRYCQKNISWQYPLVELATAVSFGLLALNYGLRITDYGFLFELVMICVLIVIAVFDIKHYLILDKIVFPFFLLSLIVNLIAGRSVFLSGILGSIVISGFFFLQYVVSKGRWIGLGDVKFGLLLGSLVGFFGSIVLLMLAYCLGAIVGIGLILTKRKKLTSAIPFGAFLSLAGIIVMLYGEQIIVFVRNYYIF